MLDPRISFLPKLAAEIGLNEAILLQRVHYVACHTGRRFYGRSWATCSLEEWQDQHFPFWSVPTIRRTIASLERCKLLISANINASTKSYSVNYEALEGLINQSLS